MFKQYAIDYFRKYHLCSNYTFSESPAGDFEHIYSVRYYHLTAICSTSNFDLPRAISHSRKVKSKVLSFAYTYQGRKKHQVKVKNMNPVACYHILATSSTPILPAASSQQGKSSLCVSLLFPLLVWCIHCRV